MESEIQLRHMLDEAAICAKVLGVRQERITELATFAKDRGESLIAVLVDRGGYDEVQLLSALGHEFGMVVIKEENSSIPDEVLERISPAIAVRYKIMPIAERDGSLLVACSDPFQWQVWDDLEYLLDFPIAKVLSPRHLIERMAKKCYGIGAQTVDRLAGGRADGDSAANDVLDSWSEEKAGDEPTVVNLVNQIIAEAAALDATDIHFEPHDGRFRIRYRIDGMLEDVSISSSVNVLRAAIVSRMKIMSGLNIAEKRLPQDGRARIALQGREYDLRVSVLPGVYGEAVVIRLQNRRSISLDLESLGFLAHEQQGILDLIHRPHGLILVTGPTGSGKTTTLYTCLNEIRCPETKIITIEDPVEYWMDDILQMQVKSEIGFTFSTALRSVLRHDPDVILVGEIRDRETADIAIRSALTGHLVFATLHTNDAASAITRLCDLGIEPFLLASSLQGVIAQRLLRKICQECRQLVPTESFEGVERSLLEQISLETEGKTWRGVGCEKCRFTGYRGRFAAGEVLIMSQRLKQIVQQALPAERIREVACEEGMRTLRGCAIVGVEEGLTTAAEVVRVTHGAAE